MYSNKTTKKQVIRKKDLENTNLDQDLLFLKVSIVLNNRKISYLCMHLNNK